MPLHLYRCPSCGHEQEEYRSILEGGLAHLPTCPDCGGLEDTDPPVIMAWVIPVVAMDAKEPGQRRSVISREVMTKDGPRQITEEVNTLRRIRQIEKDSEQRYRNGEGEPLRFRAYANNGSNMDTNSFGHAGTIGGQAYSDGQQPTKRSNIGTVRHGTDKPTIHVGPGVAKSGSTALKD